MEGVYGPGYSPDDDNQYLFDQLDEILSKAHDAELHDSLAEVDRRGEQRARQLIIMDRLKELIEPYMLDALQTFYEPAKGMVALPEDVEDILAEGIHKYDQDDRYTLDMLRYIRALNSIIWQVSDVIMEEGVYRPVFIKENVQLEILDESEFDPDTRLKLFRFVDEAMPGASLDTSDVRILYGTEDERHAAYEKTRERRSVSAMLQQEIGPIDFEEDDHKYRGLLDVMSSYLTGRIRTSTLLATLKRTTTLAELGIDYEVFAAGINRIQRRLSLPE